MHPKKIENLIRLSADERYDYFIRTVADFEEVWALIIGDDEWATVIYPDKDRVFPVWPHRELAEECMFRQHVELGATPRRITLESFLDACIPDMIEDNILFGVFYDKNTTALAVPGGQLRDDINSELDFLHADPGFHVTQSPVAAQLRTIAGAMDKEIWKAMTAELVDVGCVPRACGFATKPIFPGLDTWLAFEMNTSGGSTYLAPTIGIRCHAVHRITSYLYDDTHAKYHSYIPSTASCNLGYLMDENDYLEVPLASNGDSKKHAQMVVSLLTEHGFPKTENIRDIDGIVDFIIEHAISAYEIERICILIYLSGEPWPRVEEFLAGLNSTGLETSGDFPSRLRDYVAANPVAKPLSEYV